MKEAFQRVRGRVVMRGKAEIEEVNGRECIIVTEIPYQVNKADMIKKTADLVNDKKLKVLLIFVMNPIEKECESFIF